MPSRAFWGWTDAERWFILCSEDAVSDLQQSHRPAAAWAHPPFPLPTRRPCGLRRLRLGAPSPTRPDPCGHGHRRPARPGWQDRLVGPPITRCTCSHLIHNLHLQHRHLAREDLARLSGMPQSERGDTDLTTDVGFYFYHHLLLHLLHALYTTLSMLPLYTHIPVFSKTSL